MNHTLRNILLPAAASLLVVGSLWLTAQDMPPAGPMTTPDGLALDEEPAPVAPVAPATPVEPIAPPADGDAGQDKAAPLASDDSDEPTGFLTLEEDSDATLTAPDGDAGSGLISITLDDVEILDVVRMFTRISGANIIATPSNLQGRVTVNLNDVAWKPALESILDMHSLALDEKLPGSGVYRIIPRPAGTPEPMKVQTLFLKYASVANVSPVVTSMLAAGGTVSEFPSKNALVVRSTPDNLGEIENLVMVIDIPRDQVFIEAKFMELQDQAIEDLGINWRSLSGYSIKADMQMKLDENRTWTDQRADAVRRRDNRGAVDAVNQRYDIYNDQYQEETLEFLESPPDSGNYISQSTITPTRTLTDTIDAGQDIASDATSDFTKTFTDARSAILSADTFEVVLSALKQMNGISIVSNPKIIVANEEPALIHIGETRRPFVSNQTPNRDGLPATVTYNPGDPVDTGVKLTVTPTINTSSNITVRIEPEITRIIAGQEEVAPNLQTYPTINRKKISTVFSLDSGKTVAIGGLTETRDQDRTSKVPLLGDIPLLGKYLFSHTHKEKIQTETIIFVSVGLAMPESLLRETGLPENTELTRRYIIATEAKRRAFTAEIDEISEAAKAERERDSSEEKSKLLKRR
jgi:type IV pilus assembly protein PilQ